MLQAFILSGAKSRGSASWENITSPATAAKTGTVSCAGHLLALKKLALDVGFKAPLYTVTGWNSIYGAKIPVDEVVPVFGAYPEAPWTEHTDRLPLSPHYVFDKVRNDFEPVNEPFIPPYADELNLGCNRKRSWKKITVSGSDGFIEIPDQYDAAQIYVDGKLTADNFYFGRPWRVPASLLCGKECYLVMSEMKDDFYREF